MIAELDVAFFLERGRWVALSGVAEDGPDPTRVADFVAHLIPPGETRRLLHLGCGTGAVSIELARRGYRPVAVDVSPDLIAVARSQAMAQGVPVAFVAEALEQLDFPPYFDAVLALEVVFLFQGTAQTFGASFKRVADLLRPSGRLLFGCAGWTHEPPNRERVYEGGGVRAVETVTFDRQKRMVQRILRVEGAEVRRELHWRGYWPGVAEVEDALRKTGFNVRGRWHQYDLKAVWTGEQQPGLIWLVERRA